MASIAIIGVGYIGLVIGLSLGDFGNKITFADIDENKINKLQKGEAPFFEPGLQELLNKNISKNSVTFTTDVAATIKSSPIILIAVNTPTGKDDRADITAVKKVAENIGKNLNEDKIICIKSTVPIGTHKVVEEIIKAQNSNYNIEVVSIPEFLREGSALYDFVNPDRIIIGTKSKDVFKSLKNIFLSTNCDPNKIIWTDNKSAETIKYVSNSFLAMKVSFANEIANFCDKAGVDVEAVMQGVGLDNRIGSQFFKPGPGFGGSCFPKDILALLKMSEDADISLELVKSTILVNKLQKQSIIKRLKSLFDKNDLTNKTIAVLGLAFKGNTDDIRYSPAIDIIKELKKEVIIKAYDPQAMNNMKTEVDDIIFCSNEYDAAKDADAILLLTDWQDFKNIDFKKIAELMKTKVVLDTRNIVDIKQLKDLGFKVEILGRSVLSMN